MVLYMCLLLAGLDDTSSQYNSLEFATHCASHRVMKYRDQCAAGADPGGNWFTSGFALAFNFRNSLGGTGGGAGGSGWRGRSGAAGGVGGAGGGGCGWGGGCGGGGGGC